MALRHRVEYAAIRGIIGLVRLLPWTLATGAGARLGAFAYSPLGVRKRVVERQIGAAFPELDERGVRRVARESFESLGRTAIETALLPSLSKEELLRRVDAEGWPVIERAMAEGKGAILVTGHFGNWEMAGAYVAARGVGLDVIARRQANLEFDRFLNATREAAGMKVVWDGHAVKQTPRAIREGRAVAFVSDQSAIGLASAFVPFFGRPAKTPRGPATFALRLGAPVVFVALLRATGGRYRLVAERVPVEPTGDRDHDVDVIVAAFTRVLEKWVRQAPGQYFWQHRRWKRQPDDTPPELRDPAA